MSQIINEALKIVCNNVPNIDRIKVSRVCIGWGFTGVKLDTGHVGLCHSLLDEQTLRCCRIIERAGRLAGSKAIELAALAKSRELSESVVGTATLNALSQMIPDEEKYVIDEGNFIDYIEAKLKPTDTVALVGYIKPFVNLFRKKVRCLRIFERSSMLLDKQTLPYTACEEFLPEADIVVVTGSSIANKTIDYVLRLSEKAREIGIVGPSAGLPPDPLFKRKVTVISTIRPLDADRLLEIVAEGGGTPQIKSAVKFINIRRKS